MILKDPKTTSVLLDSLSGDTGLEHDLLFYATFADKTLRLMQREGSQTEGFSKLQQSFSEAVEKVRAIIQKAKERGFATADEYIELTPRGFAKLIDLMSDLAVIKQEQMKEKE